MSVASKYAFVFSSISILYSKLIITIIIVHILVKEAEHLAIEIQI